MKHSFRCKKIKYEYKCLNALPKLLNFTPKKRIILSLFKNKYEHNLNSLTK